MQLCKHIPEKVIWVLLISSSLSPVASFYDARILEAGLICGSYQYPYSGADKFMQNFMALMDAISFQVKERGWGAKTLHGYWHPMYALGQCHLDLNSTQCSMCFSQARQLLSRCIPKVAGRIFLDGCFLRYDNYDFFNESVDQNRDINACELPTNEKPMFWKQVASVISNVTKRAAEHRFAVDGETGGGGGAQSVFALAQCWETLDERNCMRCLTEAGKRVEECVPGSEGRSLFTGCFLRYSTSKFYNDVTEEEITDTQERSSAGMLAVCVISAVAVVLLASISALFGWNWKRMDLTWKRSDNFEGSSGSPSYAYIASCFSFSYELLEKATNFFDPANKLGQRGSGSVFKGTLPDGRAVAVKRLSFNTRQWADDGFFNEVNLITGIHNKNVVKLMGCSIEGPESLLVYEYVPKNRSLDQILFGKDSVDALSWQKRFHIICGMAEGLAYLHEGSGTKIIHKDIKASNILLDENLNPKITNFGFARCVAHEKSHVCTGIAGKLGYLAPEYLVRGQLTEKADVYAFGVVVVEIVCGKKNCVFAQGSTSALHWVWKNYKANNITVSVDPALQGKFSVEEASNALQAGLLCTQSSVDLRPSMSDVVQMLTSKDYAIPSPKQQPFLNASVLSIDDHPTQTYGHSRHASQQSCFHSTTSSFDLTENSPEHSFSSTPQSNIMISPVSNIAANIGAPEPR